MSCKDIGLPLVALIALLLLSAPPTVGAKSAYFAMPVNATLQGEGAGSDRFTAHGIGIGCKEITLSGEAAGDSRAMELLPEYSDCTAEALTGFIADFFQESCDYLLHDPRPIPGGNRWRADVDIRCHGGWDSIGWDFYETNGVYREAHYFCAIRIPEGPGAGTAQLRNLRGSRGGIEIHWSFPALDYTVYTLRGSASSLFCGSSLGGVPSDTSYEGSAIIFATDSFGRPANLSVSG